MTHYISNLGQLSPDQSEKIREDVHTESIKPLSVAVMGQTGVGKSSLLNALFGTSLIMGDVKPTTKVPESVAVQGSTGSITFWDMPGIGESEQVDDGYLSLYRQKLMESDVVLWAIHADTRSTLLDSNALRTILSGSPLDEQRALTAKLTFVLTKADLLTPPPWIFLRNGETGIFVPSRKIRVRLDAKAEFFQDVFIKPHGGLSSAWTYPSDGFEINDPDFDYDELHVAYRGFMSDEKRIQYSTAYPQFSAVFERLCDNQRVIPCSALFRYNLIRLMVATVNKLGESAIGRFQRLVGDSSSLDEVPVSVMRSYCNLVVWDKQKGTKTFDLDETEL